MELQAVVKAFFSEFDKIGHRVGSVFFKKLHLQGALVCRNGCVHGSWDSVNLRLLEARQSYHESVEVVDLAMGGGQSIRYMSCYLMWYIPRKPLVIMRLSIQFFAFLFSLNLLFPNEVVSQTNFYEDPRFPAIANAHEVIAVLPFDATVTLRPRQMKDMTSDQLERMEKSRGRRHSSGDVFLVLEAQEKRKFEH